MRNQRRSFMYAYGGGSGGGGGAGYVGSTGKGYGVGARTRRRFLTIGDRKKIAIRIAVMNIPDITTG